MEQSYNSPYDNGSATPAQQQPLTAEEINEAFDLLPVIGDMLHQLLEAGAAGATKENR